MAEERWEESRHEGVPFDERVPQASWFGNARALSRSLRKLLAEDDRSRSYVLLVVDVDLTWLRGAERAMALVTVADRLHRQFPYADPVACLGEQRFGVVVHRHPGLAAGSEALQMWLGSEPLLAGATKVLLVPLPETAAEVGPFVRELAGAQRPLRVRAYEPLTAAGGGPGAELLTAAVPISALRRERRRSRLPALVADGSGMFAAAVAALLFAVALARVMGPAGVPSPVPTAPFGLALPTPPPAPPSSPPQPEPETVSPPPAPAPEAPAVEGIVEVAAVQRRPSVPPAPPAPPVSSPSPPPPEPAPEPAPGSPQPEASPTPTPAAAPPVAVAGQGEPWPPRDDGAKGHGPKHDEPPGKAEGHDKHDDD